MTCPRCQKEIPNGYISCPFCENASQTNAFIKERLSSNQIYKESLSNNQIHTHNNNSKDPGENIAKKAKLFGILSLFLGPVFAIISLVFINKYNSIGNGDNYSAVKLGKILSIISIVIAILCFFAPTILVMIAQSLTNAWMNDTMQSWFGSSSGYPMY